MKALFRRKSPNPPSAPSPSTSKHPHSRRRRRHSSGKRSHPTHRQESYRRYRDYPHLSTPFSPLDYPSSRRHHNHQRYPFPPPTREQFLQSLPPSFDPRAPPPPFDLDTSRSLRNPQQRRRRVVSPSPSPPPPPSIGRNPTPGPPTARAIAAEQADSETYLESLASPRSSTTRDIPLEHPHFDQRDEDDLEEEEQQLFIQQDQRAREIIEDHLSSQGTPRQVPTPFPQRTRSRSHSLPRTRAIPGPILQEPPFPGIVPPHGPGPFPGPPPGSRGAWNRNQGPPGPDFYPPQPSFDPFHGPRFPPESRFSSDPLSGSSAGSGRFPHPRHPAHLQNPQAFGYPRGPPFPPLARPYRKPLSEEEFEEGPFLSSRIQSEADHRSPPPDSLSGASPYSHIHRSVGPSPAVMPRGYSDEPEMPIGDEDQMLEYEHMARHRSRSRGRSRSHSRPRSHSHGRSHSRGRSRSHSRSAHYRRSQSVDRMSFASTADPYGNYGRHFDRNPDLLFPGAAAAYMMPNPYDPYMGGGAGHMPGPYSGYGMMPGGPPPGMGPGTQFPGEPSGIVFQSARPFLLYMSGPNTGAFAEGEAPWLQLTDELDGRLVIAASFRDEIISLYNDTQGELLNLVRFAPSARTRVGGRVVVQTPMREPLFSAVIPGSSSMSMYNSSMYGAGPMGDMYGRDRYMGGPFGATGPYGGYYAAGGRFANQVGNTWNDFSSAAGDFAMGGANAFAQQAMSQVGPYAAFGAGALGGWGLNPYANRGGGYGSGGYGYSPYSGHRGMYGRYGTPGDIDPEFMQRYGGGGYMGGGYGAMGGAPALADFHIGDKAIRRSSRRKVRMPVMRLLRAPDGVRQILQAESGYEVASITLAQGSGAGGIEGDGVTHRLVVQPGWDVAMVLAAIASYFWISSEMGMPGMNMPGMPMGMPGMGMGY